MNLLISNIGCIGDTLKSAFEMVDEQAEITIKILDHMKDHNDRTEARLSELENWVSMFMTNVAGKYEERELFDAETALEKEIDLTDHEIKSIQKLNN
ncbi:hypothetical protein C1646_753018 [Rhizophagus diaphanus]|nr:hypothetical protein C1646_753018 [Rhizophagus diaphanus] [Rhizophagus sp. MUCL 43196]